MLFMNYMHVYIKTIISYKLYILAHCLNILKYIYKLVIITVVLFIVWVVKNALKVNKICSPFRMIGHVHVLA